jgi:Fic family protein
MSEKYPPFSLTSLIFKKSQLIAHELGFLEGAQITLIPIKLRKENQIKTIQSTLAIEGNSLTLEQVTGIIEGKRVVAPKKDILELNNTIKVYADLTRWDPLKLNSLKLAHKTLMHDLVEESVCFRKKGVGIFKGKEIAHIAPPPARVPALMNSLFDFLNTNKDLSWIIKACIFHYELEFIHPFSDGNGRMGRLWQQLLFMKENQIFQYINVESIIKKNQEEYYKALAECDKAGDSTVFIEFALEQTLIALKNYTNSTNLKTPDPLSRLQYAKDAFKNTWFSRKDYLDLHKTISTASASRDLLKGLQEGLLSKQGSNNFVKYQFKNN